jgi:hypothetical protein
MGSLPSLRMGRTTLTTPAVHDTVVAAVERTAAIMMHEASVFGGRPEQGHRQQRESAA